jgi:DNA-binding MarR family transcriptional regulator
MTRSDAIDVVATTLIYRSSRLVRLLASFGDRDLSRSEVGILATLLDGPRRITELADTEALAQPTVTKLVDGLEQRGLVLRGRVDGDGRVVLVSISNAGRAVMAASRSRVQALMREAATELSDRELAELAGASDTIERLIGTLQSKRSAS